jgi:two-component system, OmpR family, response regulator
VKVLLIEDDKKISDFIKDGLHREGFAVDTAFDGQAGLDLALNGAFDLLILDLMLPKLNGLKVLELLKKESFLTPILILSAKHTVEDRVTGLDAGADDYLVKPFSFAELLSRAHALLRRKMDSRQEETLKFDDLELDRYSRKVFCGSRSIDLQAKEFLLLELFIKNKDRVLSKNFILDRVWNIDFDPQTNVVDVLVCRLRNKLERTNEKKYIFTLRGVGYVLKRDKD